MSQRLYNNVKVYSICIELKISFDDYDESVIYNIISEYYDRFHWYDWKIIDKSMKFKITESLKDSFIVKCIWNMYSRDQINYDELQMFILKMFIDNKMFDLVNSSKIKMSDISSEFYR